MGLPLKGYFYTNLVGTLSARIIVHRFASHTAFEDFRSPKKIPFSNMIKLIIVLEAPVRVLSAAAAPTVFLLLRPFVHFVESGDKKGLSALPHLV
jgi:hypothetical protein